MGERVARCRSGGGYTFLELMVVITLVGIFLFFAIPRIAPDAPSDDFRRTLNWFALNIPRYKRMAVSEQRTLLLHLDRQQGALWVSDPDASGEASPPDSIARFTLPDSVGIREIRSLKADSTDAEPATLRFSPNGTSDYMEITLWGDDGREAKIHIEPFLYAAKISQRPS